MLDFLKNISPTEVIIIVLVLAAIFGAKVVTRLARSSGETVKEFKKIKRNFTDAMDDNSTKSNKG